MQYCDVTDALGAAQVFVSEDWIVLHYRNIIIGAWRDWGSSPYSGRWGGMRRMMKR